MKVDLFFCGDSFTYGSELEGLDANHDRRMKQRFSTLVSENLGMTHFNISKRGACNDWIVKNAISWFEGGNECDYAFIQFSHYNRWGWYDQRGNYANMTQKSNLDNKDRIMTKKQKASDAYWNYIQSEPNSLDNYWKNKFFLKKYLENKCKVHFMTLEYVPYGKDEYYKENFWYKLVKDIEISEFGSIVDDEFTEKYNNSDLPGRHPNPTGHKNIADHLLRVIKSQP